jgi:class 3 adenylate cyclase
MATDVALEVAHVLFMDVVGYSELLINDQSEVLAQLNQVVRATAHFQKAEAEGKLIRLATGDGMALIFFNNAEAPVKCAMEISQALQSYPSIQLRMGVHSGPISRNRTVPHLPERAVLDDLDIIGHNTVERLTRAPS